MHDDIAAAIKHNLDLKPTAPFVLDHFAAKNPRMAANFWGTFAAAREANGNINGAAVARNLYLQHHFALS